MPITILNRANFNPSTGSSGSASASTWALAGLDGTVSTSTFPDATNTGHTAWPGWTGSFTTYSGPDPIRAAGSNQVFEGVAFDGITVGVTGDAPSSVTFRGCRFRSSWNEGWNCQVRDGVNILFEYCTIEPANDQSPPIAYADAFSYAIDIRGESSVTARYCNMYGSGNTIQIEQSSAAFPVVVEHCWVHDQADQAGSTYHHDAFLSNNGGPTHITLHHNTFASGGNTNAIALQSTGTPYSDITITNNLLSGYGYTVNIGDDEGPDCTNITFEDNVFSTEFLPIYGPLKTTWPGLASGSSWRRNRWRYGGNGDPTANGKFWLPNGGQVNNWNNLTGWVSDTDYAG